MKKLTKLPLFPNFSPKLFNNIIVVIFIKIKIYLISVFIFLSLVTIQAQNITGNLEGYIVDSSGVPLEGVNILLESESLQGNRGTITNEIGYFQVLNLPSGSYKVKFSFIGYRKIILEHVQISLGKTNNLGQILMSQRTYNLHEVVISDKKIIIDPVSTTYGGNINSSYIENLPVGRSYKDVVILLPQVNVSYFGDAANFAGSRGGENKYFVDGVEVTDPLFQGKATDLPYNFIREVEVKTGGYTVDSRSSTGGLINVITKSGSNQFHGSAFGFYTSNQLSNNDKLSSLGQGDFSNYDMGFGLGGPIILDKLWLYAAYNPTFYRTDVEIPGHGNYVDHTLTHKFAFKLNWQALNKLNVNFTVNGDPIQRDQVISPDLSVNYANPDALLNKITEGSVNYSLNGTYIVNNKVLLQCLIAKVDRYAHTVPATERGYEIYYQDYINNIISGGTGRNNWDAFRSSSFAKISTSIILNQHTISAGIDYKYNNIDITNEYHHLYSFLIDSGEVMFYEDFGNWYGNVQSRIPAVFAQDNWRILDRLNVTVGLRWEDHNVIDGNGDKIQKISVPLQPHIGFVFLLDENNRQRIFGSFRRFVQEYAQLATNFNLGYDQGFLYDHDPRLDNTGGEIVTNIQHPIKPLQKEISAQYSDEFSLGYECVIGWNIKASVQVVYKSLGEAIEDTYLKEEQRYEVGNPGRDLLSAFPRARHDYKALVLSIERTGDEYFNFLASYVLSRNYGNYEYGLNRTAMFDNVATSRVNVMGLLSNDRIHVFKFSGYYSFPFGFTTGISFIAQSGTPLSEIASGVNNNEGIKFLEPRGSLGRTPAIWDLNARLTYNINFISDWHSKLILDIFHIGSPQKAVDFDQVRFKNLDETDPNANYGRITSYQPSMSVRLGMEVSF